MTETTLRRRLRALNKQADAIRAQIDATLSALESVLRENGKRPKTPRKPRIR